MMEHKKLYELMVDTILPKMEEEYKPEEVVMAVLTAVGYYALQKGVVGKFRSIVQAHIELFDALRKG